MTDSIFKSPKKSLVDPVHDLAATLASLTQQSNYDHFLNLNLYDFITKKFLKVDPVLGRWRVWDVWIFLYSRECVGGLLIFIGLRFQGGNEKQIN